MQASIMCVADGIPVYTAIGYDDIFRRTGDWQTKEASTTKQAKQLLGFSP